MELVKEVKFSLKNPKDLFLMSIPFLVILALPSLQCFDPENIKIVGPVSAIMAASLSVFLAFRLCYYHEKIHLIAAELLGVSGKITDNKQQFIPQGELKQGQLIIMAAAPFLVITPMFVLACLVAFFLGNMWWTGYLLCLLLVHISACSADFKYIYNARKYPRHIFIDNGNTLNIYRP